jgi:predicted Zn finger-like uncharacterized protein
MIVQCKKCATKFRFDESLLAGVGVWVRCSRCKTIFFLDLLNMDDRPLPRHEGSDVDSSAVQTKGERKAPSDDIVKGDFSHAPEPDMEREKDHRLSSEKDLPIIFQSTDKLKMHISALKRVPGDIHGEQTKNDKEEELDAKDFKDMKAPEDKKKLSGSHGKQLLYLIVVLSLGGIYLWFFSGIGNQAANVASSAISTLIDRVRGTEQKAEEVGPVHVELSDVRQRLVVNIHSGIMRVVEGTAVNQSIHPMARIRIRGEVVNAAGVALGAREAYCGNLLTTDELATMTEDQFQKELSKSQGSDISNEMIAPKGQIPFMIVFTPDPPGVARTFVVPAGVERLVP